MNLSEHYSKTKDFFKQSALEREGFYDGVAGKKLQHSCWQLRTRRTVLSILRELCAHDRSLQSVVDIGCGRGDFSSEIAIRCTAFTKVYGCDFSPETIAIARREYGHLGHLSFAEGDILRLPFENEQFDVSVCINTIHHIHKDDQSRALAEMARVTRRFLIVEIKNKENFFWKYLHASHTRGIDIYPLSVSDVTSSMTLHGFSPYLQKSNFIMPILSPLIQLVYVRQ